MEIRDVQFPMMQAGGGLRRAFKAQLGAALASCLPARAARIERGEIGGELQLLDRLLIAGLVQRHERGRTLEKLSGLHDWLWASDQAVRFHDQARARFEAWWCERHSAIVAPLREALAARPGEFGTLCEIGCGAGLVLHWMSRRLDGLDAFVGIDFSAAQTAANRARYADVPRLSFIAGDAARWIADSARPGTCFFTNAGVLEYFPEAKLRTVLRDVAVRLAPAVFAIVEPIDERYDLGNETASRPYGAERSWSHNYPQLFRAGGWRLRWQDEMRFAGCRWLLLVAEV